MTNPARQSAPFSSKISRDDDLVIIYWGARAWELARPDDERVASLIFPYYKKASDYTWPVNHKDVLILLDEPIIAADELVYELFAAGANVVHLYGPLIPGDLFTYDPAARVAT